MLQSRKYHLISLYSQNLKVVVTVSEVMTAIQSTDAAIKPATPNCLQKQLTWNPVDLNVSGTGRNAPIMQKQPVAFTVKNKVYYLPALNGGR